MKTINLTTTIKQIDPRLGSRTHPWVVHGRKGETDAACESLTGALEWCRQLGITSVSIIALCGSNLQRKGLCAKFGIELLNADRA